MLDISKTAYREKPKICEHLLVYSNKYDIMQYCFLNKYHKKHCIESKWFTDYTG